MTPLLNHLTQYVVIMHMQDCWIRNTVGD